VIADGRVRSINGGVCGGVGRRREEEKRKK
jgi:hypothetical protein